MSVRSLDDAPTEAVTVDQVSETVQGQPQSAPREPDNGEVTVNESRVKLDRPILDPNSPEAVQIPEGIGARADEDALLSDRFSAGTAEEQFAAEAKTTSKPKAATPPAEKS